MTVLEESFGDAGRESSAKEIHLYLIVLFLAAVIYLGCMVSPPWLVDDADAAHAQLARNMITSGDWVTGHLDGVIFLDRAPLIYWLIAISYKILGVSDWAARTPLVLSTIALCVLIAAFGVWAFGKRAGFYAGLCLSTCAGLFLFTRILNPDVMLTFTVTFSFWAFLRALDEQEPHPRLWAAAMAASIGAGMLLKSFLSLIFPLGAGIVYLLITRQLFSAATWKRLRPFTGLGIILLIALPWHVLATLRNPPYFDFTPVGGPGQWHGFLWFFLYNEQVLRFLNLRYPHDYNTVPRLWFWLLHLIWIFPWSVYFPAVAKLSFKPVDRAGRARLLALCWLGFVLVFFTFSTTQEYYSMPCYPAFALLIGSAMAAGGDWIRRGTRALTVLAAIAASAIFAILLYVRNIPTPGDISIALSHHPNAYTLSLGHMQDLTLDSFAYLRLPLIVAGVAFVIGALGTLRAGSRRAFLAAALMMVVFFHAARLALVVFDPFFSSRPLAEAFLQSPDGKLIAQGHYYDFSSFFFYTNRTALLLADRRVNLEYGSYAPGAPQVFINDSDFKTLWQSPDRWYLLTFQADLPHYQALVGSSELQTVRASGGRLLLTNRRDVGGGGEPLASSAGH